MRAHPADNEARRRIPRRCIAVVLLSGLAFAGPVPAVIAQDTEDVQSRPPDGYAAFISEASQRFEIPEVWIRAVQHAESERASDVSPAGAMGLMQIMPGTWAELRARYRLGRDPFNPHDNIIAGTAYLREMYDRYGNVTAMLAAYNAGPGRYEEVVAAGEQLPRETRDYIAKLAPVLSGQQLPEGGPTVPSLTADWRDAPLFVAVAKTTPLQPDRRSAAMPVSTAMSSPSAESTPTDSIFVAVGGRPPAQ